MIAAEQVFIKRDLDHARVPLLINITLALIVAFLGGVVARRLELPTIVGYLLAGIAIGPFSPGFVGDIDTIQQQYDLLVMGAAEEYSSKTRLFGSVDDWVIEHIEHCSVLLVRQHEAAPIRWLRRNISREEK